MRKISSSFSYLKYARGLRECKMIYRLDALNSCKIIICQEKRKKMTSLLHYRIVHTRFTQFIYIYIYIFRYRVNGRFNDIFISKINVIASVYFSLSETKKNINLNLKHTFGK